MDINISHFPTSKTARYATYGNLNPNTKYFWFVLHGSKMTCEQMLYKFSEFDPNSHFVLAPEALNRFYTNGFEGDVLASWMTKRDRLEEIRDFSEYLQNLYLKYSKTLPPDCTKICLGFSQGGTTMYRWLHTKAVQTDFLVPYSCWIPEDIDLRKARTRLSKIPTHYTYGLEDQFLNEKVIESLKEVVRANKLGMNFHPYNGDHRVSRQQLEHIFTNFIKQK